MQKNKEILDINNSEKSLKIILLGTENEKFLGENFLKKFGNYDGKIVNLIGKTNVLEVFSIIKYAQFVLGHDSAYIHIATALKIPSICLLSGHNFGDFLPYEIDEKKTDQILPVCVTSKMDCFGCGVICKLGLTENMKYPCVENIDTDEINQAIFQVLSTN